jgi:hypothetical protein
MRRRGAAPAPRAMPPAASSARCAAVRAAAVPAQRPRPPAAAGAAGTPLRLAASCQSRLPGPRTSFLRCSHEHRFYRIEFAMFADIRQLHQMLADVQLGESSGRRRAPLRAPPRRRLRPCDPAAGAQRVPCPALRVPAPAWGAGQQRGLAAEEVDRRPPAARGARHAPAPCSAPVPRPREGLVRAAPSAFSGLI